MTLVDKMRNTTDKGFAEIICQIVETVFYKAIGIPVDLVHDKAMSATEEFLKQEVEEPQHWTEADIALAKQLKEKGECKMNDLTDKVTITREQVEKVWVVRTWETVADEGFVDTVGRQVFHLHCPVCDFFWRETGHKKYFRFCPHCGAPMTAEAVDILWKRLEAVVQAAMETVERKVQQK